MKKNFVKLMGIALVSAVALFSVDNLNGQAPEGATTDGGPDFLCSALHAHHPSEGYKTCYMCGGSGVCRTCNGKGWYYNPFGTGAVDCPNCSDGRCGTCGGSGQVYSVCSSVE